MSLGTDILELARRQGIGLRIMGYQGESRLFVIIRDRVLLDACVHLECIEFPEYFALRRRNRSLDLSLTRELVAI